MPFLTHNGIALYYEQHGSGPPLLLIAGLASDSQSWLPVLPELATRFTVIVLDNRGVGRSTQDCGSSIALMAADCAALLQYLGHTQVCVAGHSMGGMVALELGRRYPHLVERMLLVAATVRNPARNNLLFNDWADQLEAGHDRAAWFRTILCWILTEHFFDNSQLLEATLTYLLSYPWPQTPAAFRLQVQAIAAFDATQWLNELAIPTCVLAAEQDILLPLEHAQALARQLPGASLEIIKGAAHSLHTEQPQAFVTAVTDFLLERPH